MQNIIEISQMDDLLESFFNDDKSMNIVVGGMAGTDIFRQVMDTATTVSIFEKILVIEGCQDYIGLAKTKLNNHVYYADIFTDMLVDSITPYDPFKPKIMNPRPEYHRQINMSMISCYEAIVIKDAHLIPKDFINAITMNFYGKICIIVDPFDIYGEMFQGIPTVVDSLNKLSPMLAMARSTYDVETRAIDRSVKGTITESKLSKRSIGKIDDKQYITNDPYLCDMVRHKQLQSAFRKNQKLLVTSDRLNTNIIDSIRGTTLTRNSLCVIESPNSRPLMKLRLYSSKIICGMDVSYLENPPDSYMRVKPANIMDIDESAYHRYNTSVLVCPEQITQRQKYSILKNSNNVIVGHI